MKIYLQTTLSPIITVYDSAVPAMESKTDWKGLVKRFLRPVVVATQDNGRVIYQTGAFYRPVWPWLLIGAAVLIWLIVKR